MAVLSLPEIRALAADGGYGRVKALSQESLALLLSAIEWYGSLKAWSDDPSQLTDAERDEIEEIVATASAELMNEAIMSLPIGTIFAWPNNDAPTWPTGALRCSNLLYNRADYPLLYDVLDPAFHVSATQFRTPQLTGRFIKGTSTGPSVGATGGAASVTLSVGEIPAHSHGYTRTAPGSQPGQAGAGVIVPSPLTFTAQTANVGLGNPHENEPPFLQLVYLIQGDT